MPVITKDTQKENLDLFNIIFRRYLHDNNEHLSLFYWRTAVWDELYRSYPFAARELKLAVMLEF